MKVHAKSALYNKNNNNPEGVALTQSLFLILNIQRVTDIHCFKETVLYTKLISQSGVSDSQLYPLS